MRRELLVGGHHPLGSYFLLREGALNNTLSLPGVYAIRFIISFIIGILSLLCAVILIVRDGFVCGGNVFQSLIVIMGMNYPGSDKK